MRCVSGPACVGTGVAHPATGCEYSPGVVVCGPCVRAFWAWFRAHSNQVPGKRHKSKASFYEAAGKRR